MDKEYAQSLLNKTSGDYNLIGGAFSRKRSFVWEDLKYLKGFISNGDRILDLGCGNGRLFQLLKDLKINYLGLDFSEKLIKEAKKRYPEEKFIVANALNPPFKDNHFDKVLSLAVFHHLPSKKLRLRFLREAKRVLKPKGILILTVWNLCQKRFLKYHLKYFLLKVTRRTRLDFKDIFYPWKDQSGKTIVQRYLHCFTRAELKKLAKQTGFKIKEVGLLKGKRNFYLVARKD